MKNVNVGRRLFAARLERLDVVFLGMATASCDELILLKHLEIFYRDQVAYLGDSNSLARQHARGWTRRRVTHQVAPNVASVAPKSNVIVSPVATVNVEP